MAYKRPYRPGPSRALDLLESLRQEYDSLAESLTIFKHQRDEYEHKLSGQLNEITAFQQSLFDLERAYYKMKQYYEDEIMRLRRELEARGATVQITPVPRLDPPVLHHAQPMNSDSVKMKEDARIVPQRLKIGENEMYRQSASYHDVRRRQPVQAIPSYNQQPISSAPTQPPAPAPTNYTGICELDPETAPAAWKREGSDWTVVYNPKSAALQEARFNVDLVYSFDHESVVCCVKFSNDGKYLATGCNRAAQIFEVATGSKICSLSDDSVADSDLYVRSVCFSPDGRYLATGAEDKLVRVWDMSKQSIKFVLQGHDQDIYSLDWTRDGRYIVSGSGDRTVKLWDAETGKCLASILNDDDKAHGQNGSFSKDMGVTSVAVNPVYVQCVAAGSLDKSVRILDFRTGQVLERFEGHRDSVYSVAFSPDGRSVVSGSLDKTLKVWDLSPATIDYLAKTVTEERPPPFQTLVTPNCRHTFAGHRDFVLSVGFAGLNGSIGRVDENGDPVASPGGDALAEIEWIVSGSKDRTVTFWDGGKGLTPGTYDPYTLAQFSLQGHKNSVISVALAPTGGLFATGAGDHKARVWRVSADRNGLNTLPPAGPISHSSSHDLNQQYSLPSVAHTPVPAANTYQHSTTPILPTTVTVPTTMPSPTANYMNASQHNSPALGTSVAGGSMVSVHQGTSRIPSQIATPISAQRGSLEMRDNE